MDMVERVARAIVKNNPMLAWEWDMLNDEVIADAYKMARAAISAMREPSLDMVEAGDDSVMAGCGDLIWQAMIDAALAEGSEDG